MLCRLRNGAFSCDGCTGVDRMLFLSHLKLGGDAERGNILYGKQVRSFVEGFVMYSDCKELLTSIQPF